jgi:sugar-specific transcriptional regulator TrmB
MTTETEKPKALLFINSVVDDAGLTPNEFRLLCHIARRGKCFSKLSVISMVTDMSVRTVQNTLKFLVNEGLVLKEAHPGRPDVYQLPEPAVLSEKLQSGKLKERKELKKQERQAKEKLRKQKKDESPEAGWPTDARRFLEINLPTGRSNEDVPFW